MTKRRAERNNPADLSFPDHLPCEDMRFRKPLVHVNHQKSAAFTGRRGHFLTFFQRNRHRLFAQNMFPRLQCLYTHLRMKSIRGTDRNRINFRHREQFFHRCAGSSPILLRHFLRSFKAVIIVSNDLCVTVPAIFRNMPHLGNFSASDDSNIQHSMHLPGINRFLSSAA